MTDYEKIYDFENLYKAHRKARLGKRDITEVIDFEANLGYNLVELSRRLEQETYQMSGYYDFKIFDPKERVIHALYYRDRIVQHALCDEVIAYIIGRRLIYDNAACQKGKGTHFALDRVSLFLRKYYHKYGARGYFLKFDIMKYFDNIEHDILKGKLQSIIKDKKVFSLCDKIIDSFEKETGKALPLGNQTSQWFALFYMDSLDRLIKEKLQVKYYSRYMDDGVLIHYDKNFLRECLAVMQEHVEKDLHLQFNKKTHIAPLANGIEYLGWHFYMTDTGKVVRKLKSVAKNRYKRKLKYMKFMYREGRMNLDEITPVIRSYHAHFAHGNAYRLEKRVLQDFVLRRE